jgi:hypothetical protein
MLFSPHQYTFFVDADIHFCIDCTELFDLLPYFDLMVTTAPRDKVQISHNGKELDGYLPFNTGILLFRKNEMVISFIEAWYKNYLATPDKYRTDQQAFLYTLLFHDIKIYPLSPA